MTEGPSPPDTPPAPAPVPGVYCPYCGAHNPVSRHQAFFCIQCGTPVPAVAYPSPEAPIAPPMPADALFAPPPPQSADERFFGTPAPPPSPAGRFSWRTLPGHPMRFGATLAGLGIVAIFLTDMPLVQRLLLGAPIFEEFLKFGVALMLVTGAGISNPVMRLLVALIPGAAFGVMEHYLTYWEEDAFSYFERVLFHSGATALTMALYNAVEGMEDVSTRWATLIPSIVIHALNNGLALLIGIYAVFAPVDERVFYFFLVFSVSTHVLTWSVTAGADRWVHERLAGEWGRRFGAASRPAPSAPAAPAGWAPAVPPAPPAPPAGDTSGYVGDTVVPREDEEGRPRGP